MYRTLGENKEGSEAPERWWKTINTGRRRGREEKESGGPNGGRREEAWEVRTGRDRDKQQRYERGKHQ
jgi:hypothetical protein